GPSGWGEEVAPPLASPDARRDDLRTLSGGRGALTHPVSAASVALTVREPDVVTVERVAAEADWHDLVYLGAHRVGHAPGAFAVWSSGAMLSAHHRERLVYPPAAQTTVGFFCEHPLTELAASVSVGVPGVGFACHVRHPLGWGHASL